MSSFLSQKPLKRFSHLDRLRQKQIINKAGAKAAHWCIHLWQEFQAQSTAPKLRESLYHSPSCSKARKSREAEILAHQCWKHISLYLSRISPHALDLVRAYTVLPMTEFSPSRDSEQIVVKALKTLQKIYKEARLYSL